MYLLIIIVDTLMKKVFFLLLIINYHRLIRQWKMCYKKKMRLFVLYCILPIFIVRFAKFQLFIRLFQYLLYSCLTRTGNSHIILHYCYFIIKRNCTLLHRLHGVCLINVSKRSRSIENNWRIKIVDTITIYNYLLHCYSLELLIDVTQKCWCLLSVK